MRYIYKITNLINGKTYVGQFKETSQHPFKWYWGSGKRITSAIKKYGKNNFKKEVIVKGYFNDNLINELERHYIQVYSPARTRGSYNIDIGGTGGALGRPAHNRKKIYQYSLNGVFIKEWESTTEAANHVNCTARTLRQCASGKIKVVDGFIWEWDKKEIADRAKTLKIGRKHIKPLIYQYDNNGLLIKTWNICELRGSSLFNIADIYNVLDNKQHTHKGYFWVDAKEKIHKKIDICKNPKPRQGKYKIFLYKGGEWHFFNSTKEAVEFSGIQKHVINRALAKINNGEIKYNIHKDIVISNEKINPPPSKYNNRHCKKIRQTNKFNNEKIMWDSIKDAANYNNVSLSQMTKLLKNGSCIKGVMFEYV